MVNAIRKISELSVNIDSMRYPGSQKEVISNLSLQVEAGEIVTLLGPSGIGKTTLLRMIAGLETRYQGKVEVKGEFKKSPGRDVQLVFQECRLLPWMNARENVLFSLEGGHSTTARDAADTLLRDMGLAGKEERWPRELSGGEIARVALARAISGQPDVLLLDEPFANIDGGVKAKLQRLIIDLARGRNMCVVLVTHGIGDAVIISDNIYIANSQPMGKLLSYEVEYPHPRSLFSNPIRKLVLDIERELLVRGQKGAVPGYRC